MRVLYVEDDANMAKSVEMMLQSVGHECETTSFGEQAIELAEGNGFDFLLLDIMLPDIDGFQVITRLHEKGINIPYLIQSGLVDRNSEFAGLAFGTGEYLVKPFTQAELVSRIEAVVARAKLIANGSIDEDPTVQAPVQFDGNERRKHRRFNTVKVARIDYGNGIDCKILNMAREGAAVRLPDPGVEIPPTFFLDLQSGEQYHCRISWRDKDKIGVKFLNLPE